MCEQSESFRQVAEADAVSPIAWLDEHGDYLFCYALSRVRDSHAAADLVQETLLGAIQSSDRFERRSSVRTWLTSILRHKIADYLRRADPPAGRQDEARTADRSFDASELERFEESQFTRSGKWKALPGRWNCESLDPSRGTVAEEFLQVLKACIEALPPRSAEAVDLADRRGLGMHQVSKMLGITTTNVGVLLYRARLALRRCLEQNWFRER